jgi:hypothetical protein
MILTPFFVLAASAVNAQAQILNGVTVGMDFFKLVRLFFEKTTFFILRSRFFSPSRGVRLDR